MPSFIIYCDKKVTSITEIELDVELPQNFDPKEELPYQITDVIQEMDWEIDWIETNHVISFYGD